MQKKPQRQILKTSRQVLDKILSYYCVSTITFKEMKNIPKHSSLIITLISVFIHSSIMAQKEKKFTKIEMSKTSSPIQVSADSLWNIMKDPMQLSVWSTLIDSSTITGLPEIDGATFSTRVSKVNAPGHHDSHEKLIIFAPSTREIAFESTKMPSFILYVQTYWKVIEVSKGQAAIQVSNTMHLKKTAGTLLKGILKKSIQKNLDEVCVDIKVYAETGEVSTTKKQRMAELKKQKKYKVVNRTLQTEVIQVSADSLWSILREFDKVSEWTSTLDHSEGRGTPQFEGTTCNERICQANKNKFVEELFLFDNEKMELAYTMTEGAPGFVKLAQNHWQVVEVGPNQSIVKMNVTMHLSRFMGFFLKGAITKAMTKQVKIVHHDLKVYAETGEVSEAKKKQLTKKKK